jgi:hypothetical protein
VEAHTPSHNQSAQQGKFLFKKKSPKKRAEASVIGENNVFALSCFLKPQENRRR